MSSLKKFLQPYTTHQHINLMITFNHLGEALYNGMKTNMTRETLQDFEINTGLNSILILEQTIQKQIQDNREEKINYLLNPNPNDNTNNHTQK